VPGLRLIIIICALNGWVVLGGHLVFLGCALQGPIVFALDLVVLGALGKQPSNLGVANLALQRQQRVDRRCTVRLRATFGFPLERALVLA
jgi:hypothetical protein